jgi:hypothetical protein
MPMEAGSGYRLSAFSSQKGIKAHGCLSSGGLLLDIGQGNAKSYVLAPSKTRNNRARGLIQAFAPTTPNLEDNGLFHSPGNPAAA